MAWIIWDHSNRRTTEYRLPARCPKCGSERHIHAAPQYAPFSIGATILEYCNNCDHRAHYILERETTIYDDLPRGARGRALFGG